MKLIFTVYLFAPIILLIVAYHFYTKYRLERKINEQKEALINTQREVINELESETSK